MVTRSWTKRSSILVLVLALGAAGCGMRKPEPTAVGAAAGAAVSPAVGTGESLAKLPDAAPTGAADGTLTPAGGAGPAAPSASVPSQSRAAARGATPVGPSAKATQSAGQGAPAGGAGPAQGAPAAGPGGASPGPGGEAAPIDPGAPGAGKTVVVGGVFHRTAPVKFWGGYEGTAAFFADLNTRGGVNGYKFKFIGYDDAIDPQRNASAVKRLLEVDKVFALVGMVADLANQGGVSLTKNPVVPVIGGMGASSVWSENPNWYPSACDGQPCYPFASVEAMKARGVTRSGLLNINLPQVTGPGGGAQWGRRYMQQNGIEIAVDENFSLVEPDFSSYVQKVKAAGVTDVMFQSTADHVIRWCKAAEQQNWKGRVYTPIPIYDAIVPREVGKICAGEVIITINHLPLEIAQKSEGGQRFATALKNYFPKEEISTWVIDGWSAGEIFAEALRRVGSDALTREKLMSALGKFKGWRGTFTPPLDFTSETHFRATMCYIQMELTETGFKPLSEDFKCAPSNAW